MVAITPRLNDVLFGKGTAINSHHGNVQLRKKLDALSLEFLHTRRQHKKRFAQNIVTEVLSSGGRFLVEDPEASPAARAADDESSDGNPYVTSTFILSKKWVRFEDEDKIISKVMHRLRENKQPPDGQGATNKSVKIAASKNAGSAAEKNGASVKLDGKKPRKKMKKNKPKKGSAVPFDAISGDQANAAVEGNLSADTLSNQAETFGSSATRMTPQAGRLTRSMHIQHDVTSNVASANSQPALFGAGLIHAPQTESIGLLSQMASAIPIATGTRPIQAAPVVAATQGVPITIPYWIKSALAWSLSPKNYIRDAIDLSWSLTIELIGLVAAAEITLTDITSEKVRICVDSTTSVLLQPFNRLDIKSVNFQRSALQSMAQRVEYGGLPLTPRAICAALGNILLEIFTHGQSAFVLPAATSTPALANNLLLQVGMPMSVRQLLCDLLDARNMRNPELSLDEIIWDLNRMRDDPEHFLFDRVCPQQAMRDTFLFQDVNKHIFGREKELGTLMRAKQNIGDHVIRAGRTVPVHNDISEQSGSFGNGINFACEAIFLSGYAGSGKSRLLQSLMNDCFADGWFIIYIKFEEQSEPMKAIMKGFNDFFGYWYSPARDPAMMESFNQVCRSITSTIDEDGLRQLCEWVPNLERLLPSATAGSDHTQDHSSSTEKVGSAAKQRASRLTTTLKSICCAGRPVLWIHDDLQWCRSVKGLTEFITNFHDIPCIKKKDTRNQGLVLVGAFRSNESGPTGSDVLEVINDMQQCQEAKVTKLEIGGLVESDIVKFLSAKLCLPMRYTKELASLVHNKTRGNPFFIIQFLKTIIQNRMLQYSVAARRWTWDCEVIDMQMISAEVAGLLTTRFSQLPLPLMQTVIVTSCFGSQVDEPTMELLNAGQLLPFNMLDALVLAINEGILEKAGPIYQFTHDLIRQTVYDGIPTDERKRIHKNIGTILLGSAANDPATYLLAVDQTNLYCKDSALSTQERSAVANINASAAKFAMSTSRFEQARSYVDMGISLLEDNHWEGQYTLSLQLYEMSASISCIEGHLSAMKCCLTEIIANVKTFEDSLTSSSLLAKMLAASSKYDEAMDNCINILSALGETFPQEIDLPTVLNELSVVQSTLANINVDLVKGLPRMTDESKLNAMKFLSMLCSYSIKAKPLMVPILGCRMVRIMIEHGFCEDCIVGLVTAGYSLFSFTDDIELGYRIGKVGESFIEESPNKHALRSRLCYELNSTLNALVGPIQSAVANCPNDYDSAMLTGDIDGAMMSHLAYCIGGYHMGAPLKVVSKSFVRCIKQATKYQQNTVLWLGMSAFGAVLVLMGESNDEVEVKSYEELNMIGKSQKHMMLLYQNYINEMGCAFWTGNFNKVVELAKEHRPTGLRRPLEMAQVFYTGIAALTLARQSGQSDLRKMGEEAVETALKWENISEWNNGHHARHLEAHLHHLNGDTDSADKAYKASLVSARAHNFPNFEAIVCEYHARYCIDVGKMEEGIKQLRTAIDKYRQWGAMARANELQQMMDSKSRPAPNNPT